MNLFTTFVLFLSTLPAVLTAAAPQIERRAACATATEMTMLAGFRRMWSDKGKDHFYTISGWDEAAFAANGYVIQTRNGAQIFGSGSSAATGLVPLYRLYQNATQTHLYTASNSYRQTLLNVAQPPFVDDGPWGGLTGYVYQDGSCPGTVPLYWASNALITDNFYTVDTTEYNLFITNGYTANGPIAWVYPPAK